MGIDFTGKGNNANNAGGGPGGPSFPPGYPQTPDEMESMLAGDPREYLINYNEEFANAGAVLFRDSIIHQTLGIMIGKNKPNALLVGPAGVGKTKIVEDIAYRLASNDSLIPDKIKGFTIYELPLSNIVAGSGVLGQVEAKIKAVIEFVEDPSERAILFIDEIHQLADSSQSTYQKIAQILKPALARGKMRVIGATTTQEAKDLADDPAFNRRFSRLIVDELTRSQTIEILHQAKPAYFTHYSNKIDIHADMLETVMNLADQYKPAGSHRPDNALTLLDRAIGDAIVARKIQEARAQASGDAAIIQAIKANPIVQITERQVKTTAVRLATGNSKPDNLDVNKLRAALTRIKGQDDLIDNLVHELRANELGYWQKTAPMTMLFIGPSGVGKTEVTKIIAREITGTDPIILDMTEFHSPASINRIIGSPAGYVGSDSHAELPFDKLESNPYQVILLDEFEKSDKAVQRLFMSAFDEGYIKTSRGSTVDFSKSIIIATTNAGHFAEKKQLGFNKSTQNDTKTAIKDLSPWFDVALLNRFNLRMTFHSIDKDTYTQIVIENYAAEVNRIRAIQPHVALVDTIPDDKLSQIVEKTYESAFGARPAKKAVHDYIVEQVL